MTKAIAIQEALIAAGIPIKSVTLGAGADGKKVEFVGDHLSPQQISDAQSIIDNFDFSDNAQKMRDEKQKLITKRTDPVILALLSEINYLRVSVGLPEKTIDEVLK